MSRIVRSLVLCGIFAVLVGSGTTGVLAGQKRESPPPKPKKAPAPLDPVDVPAPDVPIAVPPIGLGSPVVPKLLDPPPGRLNDGALGVFGEKGMSGGIGIGGAFGGRTGAEKDLLIKQYGGNMASELSVARALGWLARKQKPDGSWEFDGNDIYKKDAVSATGMALLPFLAAGETHKAGKRYQQQIRKGLDYLRSRQTPEGGFRNSVKPDSNMYGQAIAALALIEAYGMSKDPQLKAPAQNAVKFIEASQAPNGGWGYQPKDTRGDTSILGWQLQALHAVKRAKDVAVNQVAIAKANKFLDSVAGGSNMAGYGYLASGDRPLGGSLTAVGLLCRYNEAGWGPNNPGMIEGVKALMNRTPRKAFYDMYYYYYATQVLQFFGGKSWKLWNEGETPGTGMRDLLIGMQAAKGDDAVLGSWPADQGLIGRSCGRLGTTALAALTLEVYYRNPPLFKTTNGEGGLRELSK